MTRRPTHTDRTARRRLIRARAARRATIRRIYAKEA